MNDDQLADLKQFIVATVSQQTGHLATKNELANLVTKDELSNLATKDDIARIERKIDDIQVAIGEAISSTNESADTQFAAHEKRITNLEHHFA